MKAWCLPALALLCTGCAGYRLGPVQPSFMKDIRTLAVPSFKNETLIPRAEVLVADSVIRHLQQDGTYKIASKEDADAIVEGRIISVTRSPLRSVRGNVLATSEFGLLMTVEYKVKRRDTGAVLTVRNVSGSTSFFVGNDIQQDERQALPLAAEAVGTQLASQISEGW